MICLAFVGFQGSEVSAASKRRNLWATYNDKRKKKEDKRKIKAPLESGHLLLLLYFFFLFLIFVFFFLFFSVPFLSFLFLGRGKSYG
jgi:hypothetical protein